ncbi:unnamed protein product [Amaranthus hypochondriacus]
MEKEKQKHNPISESSSFCCISHVFHRVASTYSNKIAIIHTRKNPKNLTNDESKTNNKDQFFTFSQLLSAVNSLTSKLHHIFNGGNDPFLFKPNSGNHNFNVTTKLVGVYMENSVEYVITVLSILRYGGAFLPIDTSWPKERILTVISSSNVDLVIGCLKFDQNNNTHFVDNSHWLVKDCNFPVLCLSIDEILEQNCGKLDNVWSCESKGLSKFSCLMYTSGSSGKPKGVCINENGVLNRFLWMQDLYPLKEDDVLLFKTSISFVDHLQEFIAPMLVGCTLVVPPLDELKGNLFNLVDYLYDYSITRLTAVPSLMRALITVLEDRVLSSLKVLVLSGEVFPTSLWETLLRVLPKASILNIYGSTEVCGDCTYFDCKHLPMMLENEGLSSVPIGKPISNCDVTLIEKDGKHDEGEIIVSGVCLSSGYYAKDSITPLDCVELNGKLYYRMGDFGRRLPNGVLVFCGREDRTIKVNGHRIALEEVEDTLRGHRNIADAAVVFCNEQEGHAFLGAVLVVKDYNKPSDILGTVKSWMIERLPSVMIPKRILCTKVLPLTSSGKIDYSLLSSYFVPVVGSDDCRLEYNKTLEHIKEVFANSLDVAEVGDDDDFFAMGGDSILAAHVAYKLGTDMRMLYMFPSPSQLQKALMEKEGRLGLDHHIKWEMLPKSQMGVPSSRSRLVKSRKHGEIIWTDGDERAKAKLRKVDTESLLLESHLMLDGCAISRCNKLVQNDNSRFNEETLEFELPRNSKGFLRQVWKVPLDACVDASPLVTFKDNQILIFIGSHSHKFLCVNARNGSIRWEIKLEARVECSAMIDGDFSQVVVGCYQGNIYFIDIKNGDIRWTFQTRGEVKSQPTIDKRRHLVWCGSYDHNLYGLDYRNYCCVYQFHCAGSIFGSPAIDTTHDMLYIGTTNGTLSAVTLKALEFCTVWRLELQGPIFGSLSLSSNGNVLCCLVNGDVLCINPEGSPVWRAKIDGPIFAGPCISQALTSQVLVCSRNGNVYSFELGSGRMIWKYDIGDPITSSAYVDEVITLGSNPSSPPDRLVCVCSSTGKIVLLRASRVAAEDDGPENVIEKFAEFDLHGDIFSSPIMVSGQIFVGCRDDFLHCIAVEAYVEEN